MEDNGKYRKVEDYLIEEINSEEDPLFIAPLYERLSNFYQTKTQPEEHKSHLMKEAYLSLKKHDDSFRFSTAYEYYNTNNVWMSLFHYKTIVDSDGSRDSALNNLGVSLEAKGFDIQSINYFMRAKDEGNTLSMANIAERYLYEGFEDDAKNILDKALENDEINEKVYEVQEQIVSRRSSEVEKLGKVMDTLELVSESRGQYAKALVDKTDHESTRGVYEGAGLRIHLKVHNDGDVAGEVEKLSGYAEYSFNGSIKNRAIRLEFEHKRIDESGHGLLVREGNLIKGYLAKEDRVVDIDHTTTIWEVNAVRQSDE